MEKRKKDFYTIGEASKICNVSTKTLRFYDKIGVVKPDYISDDNGYRYYCSSTLLKIPIIKYYKQLGFQLEEITGLLQGQSYCGVEDKFRSKMLELKHIEELTHNSYVSAYDWYNLIMEAKTVCMQKVHPVNMRYIQALEVGYLEQDFLYDYRDSQINIEWTDYLAKNNSAITNAVILKFSSVEEKMSGNCKKACIMQRLVGSYDEGIGRTTLGGWMAATIYHIASYDNLNESYEKLLSWIEENKFSYTGEVYERYVLDYWTTSIEEEFVTEIIIPISKK